MRTSEPKHIETVCSVCGLDWKRHGAKPTLEKCIELLKMDLAQRPMTPPQPYIPQPYPMPYPYPRPWRPQLPYPYWWTHVSGSGTSSSLPIISGIPLDPGTQIGKIS